MTDTYYKPKKTTEYMVKKLLEHAKNVNVEVNETRRLFTSKELNKMTEVKKDVVLDH